MVPIRGKCRLSHRCHRRTAPRPWRWTSGAPRWRRRWSTGMALSWSRPTCQPPDPTVPKKCSAHWRRSSTGSGPTGRRHRSSAVSVAADRCWPMGRLFPRSTSGRGEGSPCATDCRLRSGCRCRWTTTPKPWRLPRDGWEPLGGWTTISPWWCPPVSAAGSSSTIDYWTASTGMPGISDTWWSSRTAEPVRAEDAVASRPRRQGCPSPPPPDAPAAEASDEVRRRTGTLVGRAVASVANLLDLELAVVAGSVALGFGHLFFEAAQEEIGLRSRLDFSRGTRVIPAGLGADGPLIGAAAVGRRALVGSSGRGGPR